MTPSLRASRVCLAAAVLAIAAACYGASLGVPWLLAPGLYVALLFGWCASRLNADHQRTLAEHDWARRRALGEDPAPLNPCCRLSRHAGGAAHDDRCTDPFARFLTQLDREDAI